MMRFLRRFRPPKTPMSAVGATDVGNVRESNQDSFLILLGSDAPIGDALLAVADGMGGHAAGEVASRIALEILEHELSKASSPTELSLHKAARSANEGVYQESTLDPSLHGMGTTLVAGLLVGGVLLICNIGDSRAYLLRSGTLKQLTKDHSWVSEMVAMGNLTPEQASSHPRRNVLTRALGVDRYVEADISRIALRQDDRILLCSDGLHALVSDSDIKTILSEKPLDKTARNLVEAAKNAGGDDNITVIVAQMNSKVQIAQSSHTPQNPDITLPPR